MNFYSLLLESFKVIKRVPEEEDEEVGRLSGSVATTV